MSKTPIEWTEFSVNPIRGRIAGSVGHYCEKISPGCKNCYSSRAQARFRMPPFPEQRGAVTPFLDPKVLEQVLRRRTPTMFFWCDMTDMFGDWVPNEWIAACYGVMAATPQHTHQLLTKRAERLPAWHAWAVMRGEQGKQLFPDDDEAWRIRQMCNVMAQRSGVDMSSRQNHGGPWPLPNVWEGVSAEDQPRADERIIYLLRSPAIVRYLSLEPLLGDIELGPLLSVCANCEAPYSPPIGLYGTNDCICTNCNESYAAKRIHWVIAGGESGPGAREAHLSWFRHIKRTCQDYRVPLFIKQLGSGQPRLHTDLGRGRHLTDDGNDTVSIIRHRKGGDPSEWPEDLRVRQWPHITPSQAAAE